MLTTLVEAGQKLSFSMYATGNYLYCKWICLLRFAINIQQFKKRKTLYGHLPPNIFEQLKMWNLVHINQVGTYYDSIIQQQQGGVIIKKYLSLICMTMIDPATGWLEIVKVPCF